MAAALAAVLMAGAPIAEAGSLRTLVTNHAPFVGKASSARSLAYLGCGTTAALTKLPKFSLTTGGELLGQKTPAKPCASPLGYTTATTGGNAGMWPNPFTGIAGLYHVVARWTVRWNATVTDHLGPHHANGQASANAYVEGVRYLVHETTGTYLYPANSWSSTIHTANGTLVAKPSTSVSVFLNQTIVSSDLDSIATWIFASAEPYAASTGGNTASATLSWTKAAGSTQLMSIVRT